MFARFDENPAMTLRVIKETKPYGRTDGRTDNVKTVYPLQTKFAGGIKRMKDLEFEMLKMKVGKLETEFNTNMCRPQKTENNDLYSARLSNIEHTT